MLKFFGILFLIALAIILGGLYLWGKFNKFMRSVTGAGQQQKQKRSSGRKYNDEVLYNKDDVVVMKGKAKEQNKEG